MIVRVWNGTTFAENYPKTTVSKIVASGTPSSSNWLRGDSTWNAPTAAQVGAAEKQDSIYYVAGNTTGTAGTWTGSISGLSAYYDGLTIRYRIGIAGASTTTLNINGLGAVTVQRYVGSSNITTHFATNAVITMTKVGSSWVVQDWYDSTDDYGMRWINSTIAGVEVTRYKIIMEAPDGKFYPLTVGNTQANTKTVSTQGFLLTGLILQQGYDATYAANSQLPAYGLWSQRYFTTPDWTFNQTTGFTAFYPVYLKGTIQSNGTFRLDNTTGTSWLTQTLPTTDDGFVYVKLGYMHNTTTAFTLTIDHPAYQYKNGKLRVYESDEPRTPTSHTHLSSSQITISVSDWEDGQATKTITGVTTSNVVWVSPTAASHLAYINAQVRAVEQETNTLHFECETTPTSNITVNVVIGG